MKWISLIFFLLTVQLAQAQVKSIESFLEDHPNIKKLFLYQSNMRILNQSNDPDFNRLIKNVKKINIYLYQEGSEVTKSQYDKMTTDLRGEGFEDLLTLRSGDYNINLLVRDDKKRPLYVCSADADDEFFLMELDGHLDLKYVNALNSLSFDSLRDMIDTKN